MKQYILFTLCFFLFTAEIIAGVSPTDNRYEKIKELEVKIKTSLNKKDTIQAAHDIYNTCKILFESGSYIEIIPLTETGCRLIHFGKDTIKHPETGKMYLEFLNISSMSYSYLSQSDKAIEQCILMDKYNKNKDTLYTLKLYNNMASAFGTRGEREEAKKYFKKALYLAKQYHNNKHQREQLFNLYSNLAFTYSLKQYDSANIFAMEAHKIALEMNDINKQIITLQAFGMINSNMRNYKLGIVYYEDAYKLAKENNRIDVLPFIKNGIAVNYEVQGRYEEALKEAEEAMNMSKQFNMPSMESTMMIRISSIYKKMGNYEQALEYLERGKILSDSVYNKENASRFSQQKSNFDNYRISLEKDLINKDLEKMKSNRMITSTIVWSLAVIFTIIIIIISRKLIKQYKLNKTLLKSKEEETAVFEEEKERLIKEVDKKGYEISMNNIFTIRTNEMLPIILNKIKALRTNLVSNKSKELLNEIEEIITKFGEDTNLNENNQYIQEVSDIFYKNLDTTYPNLSVGEKKLCALISLGFNTNEIAKLMGKTRGAVDCLKHRIRKKIGADISVDLVELFCHLNKKND